MRPVIFAPLPNSITTIDWEAANGSGASDWCWAVLSVEVRISAAVTSHVNRTAPISVRQTIVLGMNICRHRFRYLLIVEWQESISFNRDAEGSAEKVLSQGIHNSPHAIASLGKLAVARTLPSFSTSNASVSGVGADELQSALHTQHEDGRREAVRLHGGRRCDGYTRQLRG